MKRLLYLFLVGLLSSCLQNNVRRVRIIDAQGNPAKINKIVPRFNEEQMEKQKRAFNSSREDGGNAGDNVKFVNKNSGIMQQINDPNFISVGNRLPSDDVFADRITNFNYVEEVQQPVVSNKKDNVSLANEKNAEKKKDSAKKALIYNEIKNEVVEEKVVNKNEVIEEKVVNAPAKTLNTISNDKKTASSPAKTASMASGNAKDKGYFIQIGIFSEKSNAEASYSKYSKISNGVIDNYLSKGKTRYKVLLGPYNDRTLAEKDLKKVIKMGHYDVYITEKK